MQNREAFVKFLHAADIHLDSPLRGLDRYEGAPVDEIRGASRRALENLVSLASEEEVDFVILAGDLFDGDWPDFNTGLFFVKQMALLGQQNIPVYAVRGNHDAESKITRKLPWPKNVHFFSARKPDSIRLDSLDVVIHGQSFPTQTVVDDLAKAYPAAVSGKFNIGVLHTSLDGREGHATYAPTSVNVLKSKGYDYWALGHVHKREVVNTEPLVVFPGNTQGRHIRETGSKGCELVTLKSRMLRTEHRSLDVLRWHTIEVDVEGAADLDEVLERTRRALEVTAASAENRLIAVRVSLVGRADVHKTIATQLSAFREQVRALAIASGQGSVWIEKVKVMTAMPVNLAALKERNDPLGELVRQLEILAAGDQHARDALAALLHPLRQKLPAEVTESTEGLLLDDAETVKRLCASVAPDLLSRALDQGPHS
jgi:DNA repair exonuclease SbcCD nuclease subunit